MMLVKRKIEVTQILLPAIKTPLKGSYAAQSFPYFRSYNEDLLPHHNNHFTLHSPRFPRSNNIKFIDIYSGLHAWTDF